MSSKDRTSKKSRVRTAQSKHQVAPIDSESIARIRSSRYTRYSRYSAYSKFLVKTEEEDFHIRKALNAYVREDLHIQGRKTYFQRVYVLARNIENTEPQRQINKECVYSAAEVVKPQDFRVTFQRQMEKILASCEKNKCTPDSLTGLFVCMDEYSYLVIEGDEDMMANFFSELAEVHEIFWKQSKVFLVEDNIGETLFSVVHFRCSPGININDKFPPSTVADTSLMGAQHLKLKEKVKKLAETFAEQINKSDDSDIDNNTLPVETYNKLLPEIQRIDLVLKAHKFYRNVKDFALTYRIIPTHQDEDALVWPIPDNYTPMDIFERSPYDVNLTFADYDKAGENQAAAAHEENGQ